MIEPSRHPLSARFERFAREAASLGSQLYERLSIHVAGKNALLEIAAHAAREPVPNVFFGAIHYLLLKGVSHPLREYYPSLSAEPRSDDGLLIQFDDFCYQSRARIVTLVAARRTQTNEVNRSTVLAPAFHVVAERAGGRPLTLIEVGASAGLNLLWDNYRIAYSDGTVLGNPASSVHLESELRGGSLPASVGTPIVINQRIGIDLNPIDIQDTDACLWLEALVWPDQAERARRLQAALALASSQPPNLFCGDAIDELPKILRAVRYDPAICVFHSTVLYQFTTDARAKFFALLAATSAKYVSPLWHVFAENEEGLKLFAYRDGRLAEEQLLAQFDAHGRWLDWK